MCHFTSPLLPLPPQILSRGYPLDTNAWYTATLRNLTLGNQGVVLEINNDQVLLISGEFAGINFDIFDGPLYIGGHPFLNTIQVCTPMSDSVQLNNVTEQWHQKLMVVDIYVCLVPRLSPYGGESLGMRLHICDACINGW